MSEPDRAPRAIVIVMDGCGAGAAPDAAQYGDVESSATILHVWQRCQPLDLPTLRDVGFLEACGVGLQPLRQLGVKYGRLLELSRGGKDSVTGHWEMAGILTEDPFPTYPQGFPSEVIRKFEGSIGVGILGNKAASGTEILHELGAEHVATGKPIVYTSADSVFQVAAHEDHVPVEKLYRWCEAARKMLVKPNNVQRVIARPFKGDSTHGFTRTERRRDFPLEAPRNLCDEVGEVFGIGVVPELFGGRGFRQVPRTQSNREHAKMLDESLRSDARFIWANFEDFDMRYGHRNDVHGFATCLVEFDEFLAKLLPRLQPNDLLVLTADHGNDPTTRSTDHSREYAPFVMVGSVSGSQRLGDLRGLYRVGMAVADHLGVEMPPIREVKGSPLPRGEQTQL